MQCSRNIDVTARFDPCPLCGGHQVQVTGGDGMRIKELEVE
jgi:hydrogenase nickel incorporation protein HypA/HybF